MFFVEAKLEMAVEEKMTPIAKVGMGRGRRQSQRDMGPFKHDVWISLGFYGTLLYSNLRY